MLTTAQFKQAYSSMIDLILFASIYFLNQEKKYSFFYLIKMRDV